MDERGESPKPNESKHRVMGSSIFRNCDVHPYFFFAVFYLTNGFLIFLIADSGQISDDGTNKVQVFSHVHRLERKRKERKWIRKKRDDGDSVGVRA